MFYKIYPIILYGQQMKILIFFQISNLSLSITERPDAKILDDITDIGYNYSIRPEQICMDRICTLLPLSSTEDIIKVLQVNFMLKNEQGWVTPKYTLFYLFHQPVLKSSTYAAYFIHFN